MSSPEYRDPGVVVVGARLQLNTNMDSHPQSYPRPLIRRYEVPPPQSVILLRSAYFIRSLKLEAFNFCIK
jgi:hypothetical protein